MLLGFIGPTPGRCVIAPSDDLDLDASPCRIQDAIHEAFGCQHSGMGSPVFLGGSTWLVIHQLLRVIDEAKEVAAESAVENRLCTESDDASSRRSDLWSQIVK